jgi:hypothetical protein
MHFFNIKVISAMRRRAIEGSLPPVRPQHRVTPPVEPGVGRDVANDIRLRA